MDIPSFEPIISSLLDRIPEKEAPLYTSMDVRIHHNRTIVVDTNVFPAGFNNIHPLDHPGVSAAFAVALASFPSNASLLLISEENTRNPFYLSHLNTLSSLLIQAGYGVRVATFLSNDPHYCQFEQFVTLTDSTQTPITLWCLHHIINDIQSGVYAPDVAILNNDLSNGPAAVLSRLSIPILPSPQFGWYQREKSRHFDAIHQVVHDLADQHSFDPTLFYCHHEVCQHIDINEEADRIRLSQGVTQLMAQSGAESVFIKHNSGTYGMGIMVARSGEDILTLNRKGRNRIQTGKGSQAIHHYLLQEGIPTTLFAHHHPAEWVLVHVGTQLVGLFMRINQQKNEFENLNSSGMVFEPVALQSIDHALRNRLRMAGLIGVKAVTMESVAKGG